MVDAVVPASALTLDLAQELDRLALFGLGNPEVTLLVRELRGSPSRESSARGSTCASAFGSTAVMRAARSRSGMGGQLDRLHADSRFDVAFRFKENHWNGTVAPATRRAAFVRLASPL